jgi:hypothetical protein
MAKANLVQTNFTAGELSPRMLGRVDVARYNNGLKRGENVVILVQGGALGRPGTLFVAETKTSANVSRLIPYVFSIGQAYQLEFGNTYVRFYTEQGAQIESAPSVPYEIVSPYTSAQLGDIDFCQRADTMFLFHPDVPTQRLQRFGQADWRLQAVPWVTEPFDELGTRPTAQLTLSAITVGAGRTFTTTAPSFEASDVGRTIEAGGGIGLITGYTSQTQVTVEITAAFSTINYVSGLWLITGSPQTTCTPSAKDPVGALITLTLSSNGWRAGDVGKHVVINGGLCKITAFTSAVAVSARILVALEATVGAEANAWALCRSMWGQEFGYPRTGSIYQQRLHAGGSPGFPQTGWFTRLGEYYDWEIGTLADAGYSYGVDADQANPIRHMASARALVVLTTGAEFTGRGSEGGAITPTSFDIQNQSAFGSTTPAPVRVGNELAFVSPAIDEETGNVRDEIRAMSADRFDSSAYAAPSITELAEHITEGGIVDMDAAKTLLLAVRTDGQMVAIRLDRDNDVVGGTRWITDGAFESVSVIPRANGARDIWVIVRREINGVTKRYVERFVPALYMDAAVRGSVGGAGAAVWSGLGHLEGETVAVRADGVVQADAVVAGGQITLARNANAVDIGLPFTPLVELMTAEFPMQDGSAQGKMMRTSEVTIRVKDTVGARVNGRDVNFRRFGENVLDVPVAPYTGTKRVELLGYERGESDIVIEQPQANPFHLLSVVRKLEVNG